MIKKLSISIVFVACVFLTACAGFIDGRMQGSYPNVSLARHNAKSGLNYLAQGYTDLAEEKLTQALAEGPEDPDVLGAMGYYYEKTGDIGKANQYFYAAILYHPDSITSRVNYGAFLCRNGYYQESLHYFNHIHPDSAQVRSDAAYCTHELQQALGESPIYAYDTQKGYWLAHGT